MTIEERGALIAKELNRISKANNNQKLHVIAHSFTGIDARAAISLSNANCV